MTIDSMQILWCMQHTVLTAQVNTFRLCRTPQNKACKAACKARLTKEGEVDQGQQVEEQEPEKLSCTHCTKRSDDSCMARPVSTATLQCMNHAVA